MNKLLLIAVLLSLASCNMQYTNSKHKHDHVTFTKVYKLKDNRYAYCDSTRSDSTHKTIWVYSIPDTTITSVSNQNGWLKYEINKSDNDEVNLTDLFDFTDMIDFSSPPREVKVNNQNEPEEESLEPDNTFESENAEADADASSDADGGSDGGSDGGGGGDGGGD